MSAAMAVKIVFSSPGPGWLKNVSGRDAICEIALYAVIDGDSFAPS